MASPSKSPSSIWQSSKIPVKQFAHILSKEKDWYQLGIRLGVPVNDLDYIQRHHGSEGTFKCLVEVHKCLDKMGAVVSEKTLCWERMYAVLRDMGNHTLADKIHSEYIRSRNRGSSDFIVAAALAEGKGNLFQSNIILHGPPGAGKSSLKRLILGLDPPTKEEQKSTDIMEKGVRAVSIDKMNEFQIIENDELINRIAGEVNDLQRKDEPMTKSIGIFEHERVTSNDYDDFIPNAVMGSTNKAIVSIIERLDQATVPIKIYDTRWHHVVDSGGQPQFLDILPLVYRTPPSLNIVVIRLTDGLDDKQEVRFYENGVNIYSLPDRLALTNREFIINVCQIASTTEGNIKPLVMIVGTRMDELGESAAEKMRKFNDDLSQIQKDFIDVLICKDGEDNIIFPVNTMAQGLMRQTYMKEFHECITEVTSNVPSIEVPLRWLVFELDIDEDEGVMSVRDCEEKGEPLGMKPDDVKNALTFLNKSALLLYYPDEDLVLTNMDPLVGQLSTLIKASFTVRKYGPCGEKERLCKTGLFNKSYLSKVLSNFKDCRLNIDKFLKVLEHLKIIVSVGNDEYFLPSALSLEPAVNESSLSLTDKMASPLILSLGADRFLPHGFFFTVAIELLSCNDGEYTFQLCSGDGSLMEQHRSEIHIMEANGKIPGVITLTNRIKWIKVTSNNEVKPQVHCAVIYKKVNDAFNKTLDRFHLPAAAEKCSPATFPCPLCPDCKEEHYCRVTPDKTSITCTRSGKNRHVTKDISYWFEDENSRNSRSRSSQLSNCDTNQRTKLGVGLNLVDVLDSVIDVTDWSSLGLALGLPYYEIDRIRQDGHSERNRLTRMVSMWLESCTNTSWEGLVEALRRSYVKEYALASRIAQKYLP